MLRVSFRTRLIIGALVSLCLVVTPMYLLDIRAERSQQIERLNDHADLSAALLSQTVALPLWDFNYSFLEDFFGGLSTDDLITSATLIDVHGASVVDYVSRADLEQSAYDIEVTREVLYGPGETSEQVGTIVLTFSGAEASLALWDYTVRKLTSLIILLALTGVVLMGVIGHILVPIRKLIRAIRSIREGNFEVAVPGVRRSDEIGAVAQALDQLRSAEIEMQELRSEQDAETRRDRYRIVRALESTDNGVMVLDEDGKLAMQNKRAASYFGTLAKGDTVDLSALINDDAKLDLAKSNQRIDTIVAVKNNDQDCDLRIRMDPIRDDAGTELGHVFLASDMTELLRQTRRADFLASHDSLTELANRRVLETELARGAGGPVSLLVCDLDRFKQVNDTLGHGVGDQLLKTVADQLRDVAGADGIPIRLGGDEFAIVAHGRNARRHVSNMSHLLIERFSDPQIVDGKVLKAGMSVGLASCPEDTDRADKLVQMADLALYDAKKSGRGIVRNFRSALKDDALRHQLLETELSRAIKDGTGPWPVYQKQTDAKTGALIGFEALARWAIPEEGAVTPGEFIPIAEESGLIADITANILKRACTTAHDLSRRGFVGRIAVNMSPILFGGDAFNLVRRALEITRCPSHLIEIEITEQLLLSGQDGTRHEIEKIRDLGVNVALDDFGVGYSSLSYLTQFPVDKIKIDRAFVVDLEGSEATRAIVTAIAQLGHALDMTVVGEGVESETSRAHLRRCGVDVIQGWVDGKPLAEKTVLSSQFQVSPASFDNDTDGASNGTSIVNFPSKR